MAPRSTSGPNPSLFEATTTRSATPANGFIIAHCDGGARGNPGPAGFGAEITDANGIVLAQLSEFLGFRTNNYAEYSGLLASLQYALDHHHPRLRVVSDSELMVKQIQGKYKVNSPDLKPLWREARNRIAKLESFEITHALRHKNKAADALANQAMDRGMGRGTPAGASGNSGEGRPTITAGRVAPTPASAVQSLPLRAIPYPAKADTPPQPQTINPTIDPGPVRTPAQFQPARPTPLLSSRSPGSPTSAPVRWGESAAEGSVSCPSPPPPITARPDSPAAQPSTTPAMLRGFTRDGAIHLLGPHTLPDGIFVKIIPE
jgi:ribonuclease HI